VILCCEVGGGERGGVVWCWVCWETFGVGRGCWWGGWVVGRFMRGGIGWERSGGVRGRGAGDRAC